MILYVMQRLQLLLKNEEFLSQSSFFVVFMSGQADVGVRLDFG
jgi:hypothetical protein